MVLLTVGRLDAVTERVRTPRPISNAAKAGSAADCPQQETGMFLLRAARATSRTRRRTAGWIGVKREATRSLVRSTARVY